MVTYVIVGTKHQPNTTPTNTKEMAFKETVFYTETQKVKIYQEGNETLILEVIETEDKSSIRFYMDKELVAQLANQLSNELITLK